MKTASRIFLTFSILVFFAGMTFSQVASTTIPAKTATKSAVATPGKSVDDNKTATCNHNNAKGTCAQGKNFVDKNGDGKCDNCGSTGKCNGTGCGQGQKSCNGCSKSQGKGNCGGQGMQHQNGCSSKCSTPATEPKK